MGQDAGPQSLSLMHCGTSNISRQCVFSAHHETTKNTLLLPHTSPPEIGTIMQRTPWVPLVVWVTLWHDTIDGGHHARGPHDLQVLRSAATRCLPSPQGLKISVLWTLYYGILSAFAPVYSWILVLRGLVGFGIGGVPQS